MRGPAFTLYIILSVSVTLACSDRPTPAAPAGPTASAANRSASSVTFTTIFFPGAAATFPLDMNDHGIVVGRYMAAGRTHGFVLDEAGVYTAIDYPGASFTVAGAINDSGTVVGWYILPAAPTVRHGFILDHDVFMAFDPPGSTFTNPLGINARRDIAGRFCTKAQCRQPGNGDFQGFILHDGRFDIINVPDAGETNAFKLNARDALVGGFSAPGGDEELFVFWNDAFSTFALANGRSISQDNGGINARGDIVGSYCDGPPPCLIAPTGTHGFELAGDGLTTIDYPGALSTGALAINARGDIVGVYYDASGLPKGFVMSRR